MSGTMKARAPIHDADIDVDTETLVHLAQQE